MTPEEIAAAEAAQAAADAAKKAEEEKAAADAAAAEKKYDESYVKGLRTEAQKYREKLKEFEKAEEDRKQAEMTEAQKLTARAEAAEKRAKELEVQQTRTKAALKHGIPEDLHEFITGEDETTANAQAEKLAAKLKAGGSGALAPSGGRNPANGGEQAKAADEKERLDGLRARVPALNNRVLRS